MENAGHRPIETRSTRRATRYAIAAPVRFGATAGQWKYGTTIDIASLGMLFRTSSAPPPVSTLLHLRVTLCTGDTARTCSFVACLGRVVRIERAGPDGEITVAVTIDEYEMAPAPGSALTAGTAPAPA
jgi:hypothetical protein